MFSQLPDTARIWIFPLQTPPVGREACLAELQTFVDDHWAAHGAKLSAAVEILFDRFIVVAADERTVAASGCSIDALGQAVRAAVKNAGGNVSAGGDVQFLRDGTVVICDRTAFQQYCSDGSVTGDTTVFDLTITTLGQLREDWQKPFSSSWHGDFFTL